MKQTDEKFETQDNLLIKLVQNQLKQAQQALNDNHLVEAEEFCQKALQVPGPHPERVDQIRHMLKQYSDQTTAASSPNWNQARNALELLTSLKLADDETQTWQRELKLREAIFWLENNDLQAGFNLLADLLAHAEGAAVKNQLNSDISQHLRDFVARRATQQEWPLLRQVLTGLQNFWPAADSLYDWLETMIHILTVVEQAQAEQRQRLTGLEQAMAAKDQKITEQQQSLASVNQDMTTRDQTIATAQQETQRYRSLTYALVVIFIVALIAYALVLVWAQPSG